MSDPYPDKLIVEIDRERLRKYFRVSGLLSLTVLCLLFGGLFTMAGVSDQLKTAKLKTVSELILFCVRGFATGIGISIIIALLLYFIFFHRSGARRADSLEVTVEGAFLRVQQHAAFFSSDRKLHFRAIVDYATIQGWLMRKCGIHALQMTTMAGGQSSTLTIHGVKDCLRMRDVLSDIDRLRENQ